MFLTGRVPLALGLGVIPILLFSAAGISPWLVGAGWLGIWTALVVADTLLAPNPHAIQISRKIPAQVRRDEPVATRILLHNTGARTVHGRLRDGWQPTAGAGRARAAIAIPAGERRAVELTLVPRRRGELRTEFLAVRTRGPLGLAGRQARLDAPGAIRVLPPFVSRRHLPSRLARLRELDGNTSVNIRGQGTEFDSLREYVRGDDVRSIDWRATARATTTMLRTWRPERDRHVVIAIDTGRTSAARVGDGVRLDVAMEAALLLTALAARAGDHVHLVMFDRVLRGRVTRVDGPGLLPAMVTAMAPVEPQLIDTDWDALFAQVRQLTTRPSLVVLLTAQDAPAAARSFLGSLPGLAQRTQVLVGTATDIPGERIARRDATDVYREAAEERARRDADLVALAINRAGGEAIAADPDTLPPAIADRYLALKAAGRL